MSKDRIDISIVVIFYNMRREARRTLYSLTREYQINSNDISYEVIVIDNGSTQPLDEKWVCQHGDQFRYVFLKHRTPSPCEALNYGAEIARSDRVMFCIDGARILSPGILYQANLAANIFGNPFIYTLGMHIGPKPQNYLVQENYSQIDEDQLLETVDWKIDGYTLFDISSIALSSKKGYFSEISESNCMMLLKSTFIKLGGFDERFISPGGGLTNLDFFNRVNQIENIGPVMLLGEATFHQFHGGTATNASMEDHPWKKMAEEYLNIHGEPFKSYFKPPFYFGKIHSKCMHLLEEKK